MVLIKEELKRIKEKVINCKKCSLYKSRNLPVIGQGSHQAKIIFIGESPGFQENKTGMPFCGSSGKILDMLLESIKVKREDVYIANILKCRPPKNRDPQDEEIESCAGFLERQIEIISPKIICPLGRYSMKFLMEKFGLENEIQPISKIHGKIFSSGNQKIIPLYHPAVAIYNPNMKEVLLKDFKILKSLL